MLNYLKLLFLFSIINIVLCTKHLSYAEWEKQFDAYEEALRKQMRPNAMSDTILLIRKLEAAVESDPKDWDWKLRASNSTHEYEHVAAVEDDAAHAIAMLKKYKFSGFNGTAVVSSDKLKNFETKIKDQTKLYKKTFEKYETPVLRYQTRRQRRRKLRQEIAKKLFGTSGTSCAIQISVMQIPIVALSAYQILN